MAPFCQALAADLDLLIRLHDRELDAATVAALHEDGFPATMNLLPGHPAAEQAMLAAIEDLDGGADSANDGRLTLLAADFAAIYLNNAFGASPYESVWLHDEHLACQQPMFELRQRYAAAGLRVDDWRKRYDDHLVLQLQYLAHGLRRAKDAAALGEIGCFLDEHLGYWLSDFAQRVSERCETPFYAALAVITAAWVERLRQAIEEITDERRPAREELAARIKAKFARETAEVAPLKFMPGAAGPSW